MRFVSTAAQEIESLEAKIRENETDLYNDKLLEELLDQEEREGECGLRAFVACCAKYAQPEQPPET